MLRTAGRRAHCGAVNPEREEDRSGGGNRENGKNSTLSGDEAGVEGPVSTQRGRLRKSVSGKSVNGYIALTVGGISIGGIAIDSAHTSGMVAARGQGSVVQHVFQVGPPWRTHTFAMCVQTHDFLCRKCPVSESIQG